MILSLWGYLNAQRLNANRKWFSTWYDPPLEHCWWFICFIVKRCFHVMLTLYCQKRKEKTLWFTIVCLCKLYPPFFKRRSHFPLSRKRKQVQLLLPDRAGLSVVATVRLELMFSLFIELAGTFMSLSIVMCSPNFGSIKNTFVDSDGAAVWLFKCMISPYLGCKHSMRTLLITTKSDCKSKGQRCQANQQAWICSYM